jgi:C4-dicarboxylate-specific signal transduction histidine kinase
VLFRQPSVWERFRWHIITVMCIIIAQAVLIFALLFQRRQRNLAEVANKKAQAEVQERRAELAHISRVAALGELTATLAHEISQPLTAILNNISAAMRFLDAPQPRIGEVRETLADVYKDTDRAADIVRRLRGMLKRDTPGFSNVDLNHLIRTVERIVHSDAILHGVEVQLDLSPGELRVTGDSVQLQQVVLNLMTNAFSAMSETERHERWLIVRTKSVDGSSVLLEAQDNGTGIAPDKLESVFEPFITSKRDGLGMGLSICRSIVERHNGKVWATNNPKRGATFSLTLPAAPK